MRKRRQFWRSIRERMTRIRNLWCGWTRPFVRAAGYRLLRRRAEHNCEQLLYMLERKQYEAAAVFLQVVNVLHPSERAWFELWLDISWRNRA